MEASEVEARSVLDGTDAGGRKNKVGATVQSALDKVNDALNSSGGEDDERTFANEENITSQTFATFQQRKASDYKVGSGKGKSSSGTKAVVKNVADVKDGDDQAGLKALGNLLRGKSLEDDSLETEGGFDGL